LFWLEVRFFNVHKLHDHFNERFAVQVVNYVAKDVSFEDVGDELIALATDK